MHTYIPVHTYIQEKEHSGEIVRRAAYRVGIGTTQLMKPTRYKTTERNSRGCLLEEQMWLFYYAFGFERTYDWCPAWVVSQSGDAVFINILDDRPRRNWIIYVSVTWTSVALWCAALPTLCCIDCILSEQNAACLEQRPHYQTSSDRATLQVANCDYNFARRMARDDDQIRQRIINTFIGKKQTQIVPHASWTIILSYECCIMYNVAYAGRLADNERKTKNKK